MPMALEDVRVLDLSVFQQGSYASAMLADMGADVIKIEAPDHPDPGRGTGVDHAPNGLRAYFQHLNRNKRGICLDLKHPSGKEVFLRLVESADVFHNNMRPGVLRRLGLTYETLSERNPRIIVSSATGWGAEGPDADAELGSMDILAQARGGIMSVTGTPDSGPMPVGVPFADHVGAIVSAYGMMVALWERERSGVGQEVNTSLFGAQLCIQGYNITNAMWTGREPQRQPVARRMPHWSAYECSDGGLLMLGAGTPDRWWADFCTEMGCEELAEGRYSTNSANGDWREQARRRIGEVFSTKTRDEWMAQLSPRFFVQPVRSYLEIAEDPQAWANGYLVNIPRDGAEPVPTVGPPVQLSRTPPSVRTLGPELGQHTEEVLLEAGFTWEDITALRDQGAFGEIPTATEAEAAT
ncbi:MAG: CoA transferase [Dehalococcoidia bacterium]|nr:CoA transferase [Dehalococcoidia bacterium]